MALKLSLHHTFTLHNWFSVVLGGTSKVFVPTQWCSWWKYEQMYWFSILIKVTKQNGLLKPTQLLGTLWLLNIWTTREMLLRLKIKWKRHCLETRRGMYNCRFQWNKLTMQIQGKREAFQSIFEVPKQRKRHVLRQH